MSAEPVIEVVRFNQAVNRLEVMRGMSNVPDRLFFRLLRKYPVVNFKTEDKNFRIFNLGEFK